MELAYRLSSEQIQDKLKKYRRDLVQIFQYSKTPVDAAVKYTVQVLHDDNNPEIASLVVQIAFEHIISMEQLLKLIVKMLYTVRHIKRYRYGDFYILKNYIDTTLDKIATVKAELAKKKYPDLLEALEKDSEEITDTPTHIEAMEQLRDNVNRGHIKFV